MGRATDQAFSGTEYGSAGAKDQGTRWGRNVTRADQNIKRETRMY